MSYAQNREDVRLYRAFPRDNGFYIDVGAADPHEYSVTKSLSLRGWRGINLEPQPYYFDRLVADRPNDINLKLCVSERPGEITFFESASHRGFSTADPKVAAEWSAKGISSQKVIVPTVTLAEICERYAPPTIDFLKVDVEGHERSVLLSADFKRFRPVVLIIEATEQNNSTPNHHLWEDVVLKADYRFAAFDGLNRYYVRSEDAALAEVLAISPNIFDNYGPADVWNHVDELKLEIQDLRRAIASLSASLAHAQNAASNSLAGRFRKLFQRAA
ncbi:MAG: FkbM family methyltransferase [Gemmataceae bacterium]